MNCAAFFPLLQPGYSVHCQPPPEHPRHTTRLRNAGPASSACLSSSCRCTSRQYGSCSRSPPPFSRHTHACAVAAAPAQRGSQGCSMQARPRACAAAASLRLVHGLQAARLGQQRAVVLVRGLALRELLHAGGHEVHDHGEHQAVPGRRAAHDRHVAPHPGPERAQAPEVVRQPRQEPPAGRGQSYIRFILSCALVMLPHGVAGHSCLWLHCDDALMTTRGHDSPEHTTLCISCRDFLEQLAEPALTAHAALGQAGP